MTPEQEIDLKMSEPESGEVVRLAVAYPGGPKTYTYAAIEAAGEWYLTGSEVAGRSWERLINWLKDKNAEVVSLHRATSWEDIL